MFVQRFSTNKIDYKTYKTHKTFSKEISKHKTLYKMMLPGLIFFLIFNYLPMIGVVMAFQDYNPVKGILGSEWVGLQNFEFFFKSDAMFTVTFNTIFYNVIFIIIGLGFALLFSILFNETGSRIMTRTYKSIMLFPYFMSWVVVQYVFYAFLNMDQGILNKLLATFGIEPINWYWEPSYWRYIFPLAYLWKVAGYYSVIFVAGITGISNEYYEAAKIDGATKFKQVIYITIPLLTPVITTLFLLQAGKIFYGGLGDWGMFYTLPNESGFLLKTTDVIDTYVFRALRSMNEPGMASAVGLYQSVVGLILVSISNYLVKRYDPDNALF